MKILVENLNVVIFLNKCLISTKSIHQFYYVNSIYHLVVGLGQNTIKTAWYLQKGNQKSRYE